MKYLKIIWIVMLAGFIAVIRGDDDVDTGTSITDLPTEETVVNDNSGDSVVADVPLSTTATPVAIKQDTTSTRVPSSTMVPVAIKDSLPPKKSKEHREHSKDRNSIAFGYETENGQIRDENIDLKPAVKTAEMEVKVKGSYSFISADGYEYTTYFRADKEGYQPYVTAHKIKTDKK